MLKTVDEACDFVGEWCGERAAYPGGLVTVSFGVPSGVMRLNARVGKFWKNAKQTRAPALKRDAPFARLLEGQDRILHPNSYAPDANGIVAFVRENQDVWTYGFNPDDPDRLLVSGDWCDGLAGDFRTKWRPAQATTEDALVCALLINLCMQSEANWDDDAPKPDAAHQVLWQHPAWSDFDGFWIDEDRTMIYFSGWQVTRR